MFPTEVLLTVMKKNVSMYMKSSHHIIISWTTVDGWQEHSVGSVDSIEYGMEKSMPVRVVAV